LRRRAAGFGVAPYRENLGARIVVGDDSRRGVKGVESEAPLLSCCGTIEK